MALKIAADIHGHFDELLDQLDDDDTLILCGDYVQFIDYETLDGILAELVSKQVISRILELIQSDQKDLARKEMGQVFMTYPNLREQIGELMKRDYQRLFSGINCQTYLISGNCDHPDLVRRYLKPNQKYIEAQRIEIDGLSFGLVSGMPPTPYTFGLPGEITESEFARRLHALDHVDVLLTHAPPALTDLTYDVVADRDEVGSSAVLEYIERFKPKSHYFGHVHKPRASTMTHQETKLRNISFPVTENKVWHFKPDS